MEHDGRELYKFEYYEPEDSELYVEWAWLTKDEVPQYLANQVVISSRKATADESNLYEEAYADGYGIAAMLEFENNYDGITFRVELDEDGELNFEGKKMFECAVCTNHKDFDEEVAMTGDLYLGVVKDEKLWHICYDCALLGTEIGTIEITSDPEATN